MKKRNPGQRAKAIKDLLATEHNLTKNPLIVEFLETYIDCEITAHKIVRFYKRDKYNKTDSSVILHVRNIINAAAHFNLSISSADVRALFAGGKGKRGVKTPRQLRNGYLHAKAAQDALELERRADTLFRIMRTWLSAVNDHMRTLAEEADT